MKEGQTQLHSSHTSAAICAEVLVMLEDHYEVMEGVLSIFQEDQIKHVANNMQGRSYFVGSNDNGEIGG